MEERAGRWRWQRGLQKYESCEVTWHSAHQRNSEDSVAGVSWGKGENDLRLEKLQGPDSTLSEMESTIMYYHVLREYYPDSTHQRRIWFSFSNNHSGCVQSAAWRQAWKREMRKKILKGIQGKSWCLDLGGSGGSSIYTDLYIDIYVNYYYFFICQLFYMNGTMYMLNVFFKLFLCTPFSFIFLFPSPPSHAPHSSLPVTNVRSQPFMQPFTFLSISEIIHGGLLFNVLLYENWTILSYFAVWIANFRLLFYLVSCLFLTW